MGLWDIAKTGAKMLTPLNWLTYPYKNMYDQARVESSREYEDPAMERAADDAEINYRASDRFWDCVPLVGIIKAGSETIDDIHAWGSKKFGDGSVESSDERKARQIAEKRYDAAEIAAGRAARTPDGAPYSTEPQGPNSSEDRQMSEEPECP